MRTLHAPMMNTVRKGHYVVLDGLRGVAAAMVVLFHIFGAYSGGNRLMQRVNHGYLAVDFFFMLSGFVIAYAYDERWALMSQGNFYKRRLIRLQPMVIAGAVLGSALFYFQAGERFPSVGTTPVWKVLALMLLGCLTLPLPVPFRVHGYQEMYPLNGPAWSLFFEYFANVFYAVGMRKLSNRALGVFVTIAGAFLIHLAVLGGRGDLLGGWSLAPSQLRFGFIRLLFGFFAGVLIRRSGFQIHLKGAFWICSLLLVVVLAFPRLGGEQHLWMNGLYEAFCVIVMFPVIVAIGVGEQITEGVAIRLSRLFGDLSYPLYVTHAALINIYTAWVFDRKVPVAPGLAAGIVVFLLSVALAYACLKLYDEPVRRWLGRKFLRPLAPSSLDAPPQTPLPG